MKNETQAAIEIINNCRGAIDVDGAPFVMLDKADIDILYAALQSNTVDVGTIKREIEDFITEKWDGTDGELSFYLTGMEDGIDALNAKGYLNTPPQNQVTGEGATHRDANTGEMLSYMDAISDKYAEAEKQGKITTPFIDTLILDFYTTYEETIRKCLQAFTLSNP